MSGGQQKLQTEQHGSISSASTPIWQQVCEVLKGIMREDLQVEVGRLKFAIRGWSDEKFDGLELDDAPEAVFGWIQELVAQATPPQEEDIVTKFKRLVGIKEMNNAQLKALWKNSGALEALARNTLPKSLACSIWEGGVKNAMGTSTRFAIAQSEGWVFDGALPVTSQPNATLYVVFGGARTRCAKVFSSDNSDMLAEKEYRVSQDVQLASDCRTCLKVEHVLTLSQLGSTQTTHRSATIMPLYAKTARDVLNACIDAQHSGIVDRAAAAVATGTTAGVVGLFLAGYGHCDIKPDNLLIPANEELVVLGDLGSCTRLGEAVVHGTRVYSLDAPPIAGLEFDLTCLGTTLATLGDCKVDLCATRNQLEKELESNIKNRELGKQPVLALQLAARVLKAIPHVTDVDTMHSQLWQPMMGDITTAVGPELAMQFSKLWPK